MGLFKFKKKGLRLSIYKRSTYLSKRKQIVLTPGKSPFHKKLKYSSTKGATPSPAKCNPRTPIKSSRKQIAFISQEDFQQHVLNSPISPTAKLRKTSRTPTKLLRNEKSNNLENCASFKMPAEILNDLGCTDISMYEDHMNSEEGDIGDHDADSTLKSMLPAVIEELRANGKLHTLEKFFRLVKEKSFPLQNIAFLLWSDVVDWFDNTDTRQMRYSPESLKFFWVGKKLFGGRFIRFMSGMKNETSLLQGSVNFNPLDSRINFACPSENILSSINPLGNELPVHYKPGILEQMITFKAKRDDGKNSYVLMVDGKKIKRGTDVDLLGFETKAKLKEKTEERDNGLELIRNTRSVIANAQSEVDVVEDTPSESKNLILTQLICLLMLFSGVLRGLRELKVKKESSLRKLKEIAGDDWRKSKYAYAIDMCMTNIWRINNVVEKTLKIQRSICETGAHLNKKANLFAKSELVDLNSQENLRLLKSPETLPAGCDMSNTSIIKQRTTMWHDERDKMKVTGSSIYQAIGCDTLKSQKEHFDKVVHGIKPAEPSDIQQEAMRHGTDSEIHQIATMCGVIMPFLFPDLVFHEVGFYKEDGIIVSPDGSLKNCDQIAEFAFEGKAPMEKQFTTTIHYKVPTRYVTQTLFEQKVLNARGGTLYLSWTSQSCTLFKLIPDETICNSVMGEIREVYMKDNLKRPTRISNTARQIKKDLTKAAESSIFLGEFPSVQGCLQPKLNDSLDSSPYVTPNRREEQPPSLTYDNIQRHLLLGEEVVKDAYELNREIASQVVVYLIADLDRLWKEEEPHAVPVAYFYRGHSLSMDIMRKITESCKDVCRSNGLDVVVSAADGEFTPLIVRGLQGNPLTQHQLSKDVWKDVCLLTKSEIVKRLLNKTKHYTESRKPLPDRVNPSEIKAVLCVENANLDKIRTPKKGWIQQQKVPKKGQDKQVGPESANVANPSNDNDIAHVQEANVGGPNEITNPINGDNTVENPTVEIASSTIKENVISSEFMSDVSKLLFELNNKKWGSLSNDMLYQYLLSAESLKKFTVKELVGITKYINNKQTDTSRPMKTAGLKKHQLVNQLSHAIADGTVIKEKIQKKKKTVPSLKVLANRVVMKKTYPKKVLNIAYSNFIWPEKLVKWKQDARVQSSVIIHGVTEKWQPYYVPDCSKLQDFEVFVYDKTHLGSNLRKALCLDRVEDISIKAWKSVAELNPDILNPQILEVTEEGKILDQMKEKLARNMLSKGVQDAMKANGNIKESEFCEIVREGLYAADDTPGIPALTRCRMRLRLLQWLEKGVDFGDFPPYGSKIKGMSNILYEGLRSSNEAKLYLYALAKKGTYCVRAPNTLCSESFFSTMQEMDPWGQGVLTASGVEKQISDFTTLTAMKMMDNRPFHIRTKRDAAYPVPSTEIKSSGVVDSTPTCKCRSSRYISCIVPKDHFFDTEARARIKKQEKTYKFSDINQPQRGEQPIRARYGYKINEAKLLPSKRLGLKVDL